MGILFVCATNYQIINAINIKKQIYNNIDADIIIVNNSNNMKNVYKKLEEVNIFSNVYLCKCCFDGIFEYLKNIRRSFQLDNFWYYLKNSRYYIYNIKIFSSKTKFNKKIEDSKIVKFNKYKELICFDTLNVVRDCIKIFKEENKDGIVSFFDEGLGSYLCRNNRKDYKINNIYLYEPDLMLYPNDFDKIIKIPKIIKSDIDTRNILNFIFEYYHNNKTTKCSNIFFDQPWPQIPKYLLIFGSFGKLLFYRSYQRHKASSRIYFENISLLKVLRNIDFQTEYFVKMHPRSNLDNFNIYKENGFLLFSRNDIPWEIFLLNESFVNFRFFTVYSSAALAEKFTFSSNNKNYIVLLFNCIAGVNEILDSDLHKLFENIKKRWSGEVFIPNNKKELKSLIQKFDNNMKINIEGRTFNDKKF